MLPQGRPADRLPRPIPSDFPVKRVRAAGHLRKKRPDQTRVLLVEGNAGDARLVREMLAEAGALPFDLIHVSRLSDALKRLKKAEFDAVLLDLNLPDARGLDAIAPLSDTAPDVPIVVLSGLWDESVAVAAVQRGAQDYLVKGQGGASLLARSIRYAIERKQSEKYISYLAYHDALTNLPNRRLLLDRLEQALALERRNQSTLALLFLDLDHFKHINDVRGHSAGDELLKRVAARLRGCVRQSDTIARIGGDEFAMILADIDRPDDARIFAEKVLSALEAPFCVAGAELFVTASIGISLFPDDAREAEALLRNADVAMYRSKRIEGNTSSFYSRSVDSRTTERLVLSSDLRRAIERGELLVHYQPLVDLESGRTTAFEALARWQHPVLGLIPPTVFIPLAEETGLITRVGAWVLRSACLEACRWQDEGLRSIGVSVNLSSQQFNQAGLLDGVIKFLEETGMEPGLLELELTESGIMRNPESAITTLSGLRSLGVRIYVDDFGTGYSSLSHLKRLPIDGLKIDRSFVMDAAREPIDAGIVRAIIAMAHGLKMQVTAEGVTMKNQVDFLRELSCDRAQGFYFSPPLPRPALAKMIEPFFSETQISFAFFGRNH
ncbi:MAG: EAL domain-containing protein [Deltaproteobacteria bacterium]|nr:EAL domain-containing protein [Deltaproteobacteria bacterium]